ncbi:MAG: hypothetical protein EA422_05105 [Gemmatimonadales bacterium]|nr:MAG: hypothetical protein EA422_05105 [Gemmatimonadales bacterium]
MPQDPDSPDPSSLDPHNPDPRNLQVRQSLRDLQRVTLPRDHLINLDLQHIFRFISVSGRYEGDSISPDADERIVLRVDVDARSAHSPVLNRLSADIFRIQRWTWGGRTFTWTTYQRSWIVDEVEREWEGQVRVLRGGIRNWSGGLVRQAVEVRIPVGNGRVGAPVEVFIRDRRTRRLIRTFHCTRTSRAFRDVRLEVAVCDSVNSEPILPTYNTHAASDRPTELAERNMTMASAFDEAGVHLDIPPTPTVFDDSAAQFTTWSNDELHDAMETHFSRYAAGGAWPKWDLWGILCGRHDNAGLAGIMFDWSATNRPPERQGFALFRNHWWFNSVPSGAPITQAQARALRVYLYTWVHEAGHAFNFVHSWNKGRPDSLSWMNYPQNVTNFWNNFLLEFDEEELIHLRHGDRASVIPGGDAWATGLHLEDHGHGTALLPPEGEMPLEFRVRSAGYVDFLEPVEVEFRLRNTSPFPWEAAADLRLEAGYVSVEVQKPSGQIVHHDPLLCELGPAETRTLQPEGSEPGTDRFSQTVSLAFGKGGFTFAEPGEYRIRATYHDPMGVNFPSAVHSLRVGNPAGREEDRMASDVFSREVGLAIYLDGSNAPALKGAMDVLREVADRFKDSLAGVHAALTVAKAESRSHFRLGEEEKGERPRLTLSHAPDPEEVLKVTQQAARLLGRLDVPAVNLLHHELVRDRALALVAAGRAGDGRKEVRSLKRTLQKRGVNAPVLEEIERFALSLD